MFGIVLVSVFALRLAPAPLLLSTAALAPYLLFFLLFGAAVSLLLLPLFLLPALLLPPRRLLLHGTGLLLHHQLLFRGRHCCFPFSFPPSSFAPLSSFLRRSLRH